MAWFYRVVQQDQGRWVCRFGRERLDEHEDLVDAIGHCGAIAAGNRPARLFVHYLDGLVTCVASF
jgi:hypothetical protein